MSSQNAGCLGFLFGRPRETRPSSQLDDWNLPSPVAQRLPYNLRRAFLSPAELSFYHVLRLAAGEQYAISCKVGLSDIFYVAQKDGRMSWHNKIDRKHVDFLLCNAQSMLPIAGIELDDASHYREDRYERDAFVDEVFQAAGLPLFHMPARRSYSVEELRESLGEVLTMAPPAATVTVAKGETPTCPRCGVPMVRRAARKNGSPFWGCKNYPQCREI
ncbi:MAG: DUF2726 domain-containing protein, partial [Bacillota bacterium]